MQFETDMNSPHVALFLQVRETLLSIDDVEEQQKPRITTYMGPKGGVCHVRTMPEGVDIGFLKGAKLEDKYGALTGSGKTLRVLSLTAFDRDRVSYYLQQALALVR